MHKIVFILPYFGQFHNYFNFWIESVKNNPTIDWILYTDNKEIENAPTNLIIKIISFEDFGILLKKYFSFDAILQTPYKLCDYKIILGEALKEDVKNYDFWGFCDCDLIWGDLRKFVTTKMLKENDHLFGLGPFQLQRVGDVKYQKVLDNLMAQGKFNLKEVFSNNDNFVADELPFGLPLTYYKYYPDRYYNEFSFETRPYDAPSPNFLNFIDGYNSIIEMDEGYKETMYYKYKDQVDFWKGRDKLKRSKRENIIYKYDSGTLLKIFEEEKEVKTEEIMYVHFTKRKFKVNTKNYSNFTVVPNRIITLDQDLSTDLLKFYGGRKPIEEFFINIKQKFMRKFKIG